MFLPIHTAAHHILSETARITRRYNRQSPSEPDAHNNREPVINPDLKADEVRVNNSWVSTGGYKVELVQTIEYGADVPKEATNEKPDQQ